MISDISVHNRLVSALSLRVKANAVRLCAVILCFGLSLACLWYALPDVMVLAVTAAVFLALIGYYLLSAGKIDAVNADDAQDQHVGTGLLSAAIAEANFALVVTDSNGQLIAANSPFQSWFPAVPTPPDLPIAMADSRKLAEAGRQAWRNGHAIMPDLRIEGQIWDVQIKRAGLLDDHLIWSFVPPKDTTTRDYKLLVDGAEGRRLGLAGIMAVLVDADGSICAVNGAFAQRVAEPDAPDPIGMTINSYFGADEYGQIFLSTDREQKSALRINPVPLDDGEDAPILFLITEEALSDEARVVAGVPGSIENVEAMLARLPLGLALVDREGRFLFLNDAFRRAAGISMIDMPVYPGDLVIKEDKGAVADAVRRFATGRSVSGDMSVRLVNRPDEVVSLSIAGTKGPGDAAVLLSLKDNTEESRLKRQLAQQTKMQAVGQLAGGVAHDFNNILTAIIGHCDLMMMRHSPGDSDYDDIQQIKLNGNRAASLTRQLLAFSRQQTLRPQVLQLPDIISEISSLLKRLLGETVRLEVKHGRNLGAIRADPGQLEQVIVNLAVNARDAMAAGTDGVLTIQTFSLPSAEVRRLGNDIMPIADYAGLSVSDTGTGIPPEMIGKIFEPFFTTKEVGKGTGLGLSTVYGIVKQSEGFIFADSVVGTGTTFTIYFPVHRVTKDSQPVVEAAPPPRSKEELWGTGTILLVEDEAMVRAVAERALTRQGYTILTAINGEEALEQLERADQTQETIDLMISDVVMPGMDGPTMVKLAREKYPHIPVLFMSGYAEEQLRKSIDIDNVAFLPKPFSVQQLAEAVRKAMIQAAAGAPPAASGEG